MRSTWVEQTIFDVSGSRVNKDPEIIEDSTFDFLAFYQFGYFLELAIHKDS